MNKNNIQKIEEVLANKKVKKVAMVAPSFLTDFEYPKFINQLKSIGFSEVVEVTFGAKIVNREYHRLLRGSNELNISTTCPGIIMSVNNDPTLKNFSQNLAKIDSPMVAMAKVCRKLYPNYKIFFISPCHMKKLEAEKSPYIDYVLDFQQVKVFLEYRSKGITTSDTTFDQLYNDYTKIYPLSGGLSKTAKIGKILKKREYYICDGWPKVKKLLLKIQGHPKKYKHVRFLDVTFCNGGCIGGPCTNQQLSLKKKHHLIKDYMKLALREKIPKDKMGVFSKASGLKFSK